MPEEMELQKFKEWREREKNQLEYLEHITSYPQMEQEKILRQILSKNATTEYLQHYELNGATDVQSFRERLPVSDYESYKPLVNRIFEGDMSPLLCADPVTEILISSGTSKGEPKLYAVTAEDFELRDRTWRLIRSSLNRAMPGLEKGKAMFLHFIWTSNASPGGLPCQSVVTSFIKKSLLDMNLPLDPSFRLTSPKEVITGAMDNAEVMYCHLLLGLLQREEVVLFGAVIASLIIKAIQNLEEWYEEICEDIASGTLSSRVKDERVRSAVLPMLKKDAELAELVRNEFRNRKSSDGIIQRLWPNVKVLESICTGTMQAYLPIIERYSDNLPIFSPGYGATEGSFGVNLNPIGPPKETYYTLLPCSAYFEFIPLFTGSQKNLNPGVPEILDLMSLEAGQEYELLVTTLSGLYRYRIGDVLKVVGFYNSTPTFQFVGRRNIVLSVDTDKTGEIELHTAVCSAIEILERQSGLKFLDYTSTCDFSSVPGHYVIFWELFASSQAPIQQVLEECCAAMEANLGYEYLWGRQEKYISALELRLVEEGTFDLLAKNAASRGTNPGQYKTPRGIDTKRVDLLEILNSRVSLKAFSLETPAYINEIKVSPSRVV